MNRKNFLTALCIAAAGLTLVASIAIAQQSKDEKPAPQGQPEMKLPEGWTQEDMNACAAAGMPGEQHDKLAKAAGEWLGKCTMWMGDGAEPATSNTTCKYTPVWEKRYVKMEVTGEMPGMGPFHGLGVSGYDNVAQKYVSTWIDSMGTGIMSGVGEMSADGKTLTWIFTYNCPVTKKPTTMRQVEKWTGDNSMTLEMFHKDPKTGKEFKAMMIESKRK